MRHNVSGRKLSRTASHRRMLYRNLVTELFRHERIQTTVIKAKEARSLAERLITFAKAGDLHARRQAARKLTDPDVLQKLFGEIGPRYTERPGGYTRILRISGGRKGDNAEMAILELVDTRVKPKVQDSLKRRKRRRELKAEEKAEAAAALAAPPPEEERPAASEAEADRQPPGAAADATTPDSPPDETSGGTGKAPDKS